MRPISSSYSSHSPGRSLMRVSLVISACLLCAACNSLPKTVSVDFPEYPSVRPMAQPTQATPANGSLFQKVSYRPAFEDPRARAVGDSITILIQENINASQVSSSTANRTTSGSTNVGALPAIAPIDLANINATAATAHDFSGKGGTQSANAFTGTITATVVEVLPNGHLVVTGDKQIGVNQNVDVMRFSGTIDPHLIQPGNLINSTQVANARIESKGRGAQAEAQTVGWFTRFFFSFMPF